MAFLFWGDFAGFFVCFVVVVVGCLFGLGFGWVFFCLVVWVVFFVFVLLGFF